MKTRIDYDFALDGWELEYERDGGHAILTGIFFRNSKNLIGFLSQDDFIRFEQAVQDDIDRGFEEAYED